MIRIALILALLTAPLFADSRFISGGENLVTDGIPPIPAEIAEQVGRYTEFRSASLADWHPAQRQMLIRTRFAETSQVHRVQLPGGAREQLTFVPDGVDSASFDPAPANDQCAVLSIDVGGSEFDQLYRFDLASGEMTLLTDGKSRNSSPVWATSGGRFAFASTRRNGRDNDIYILSDPAGTPQTKLLKQLEGGGWWPVDWSPDDRRLLVREYISIVQANIHVIDVETGELRQITPPQPEGEKVYWGAIGFAQGGKGVYVITDLNSEFKRLAYLPLDGPPEIFTPELNWDISGAALSHDGKLLAFTTNEAGVDVLHVMDTATRTLRSVPRLPPGQIYGLEWHRNHRDLAFGFSSATSGGDVHSLDITTGKLVRWTFSESGGLRTENFVQPRLIEWKSFDDRTITGFHYSPPGKFQGKRPVIVVIHGGPEGQSRPGFLGRYNYYLNELGVALIFPNVRGSNGYGKSFLGLDNAMKREDSVRDIGALLDWIAKQPDLDADRIMLTGGSYGGYMTLAGAVHFNDRIRCSLASVGISNFVTFLERTQDYRRDLRRQEYGDERDPAMREFLLKISPANHAGKITKPLFIVQGANDPRVPLYEAEQMLEAVKRNGGPVWYLMAKDEGHGFAKKSNIDFQFYATVLFVREHLLR